MPDRIAASLDTLRDIKQVDNGDGSFSLAVASTTTSQQGFPLVQLYPQRTGVSGYAMQYDIDTAVFAVPSYENLVSDYDKKSWNDDSLART